MLPYPDIDPVAVQVGPLQVHWYGVMYLVGFVAGWWLGRRRARQPWTPLSPEQVDDLLFYTALGVVIGGRVGYILFYNLPAFLTDPLTLFRVWEGGMSFHGGLLGVLVALGWFAHRYRLAYFAVVDFLAPLVPIGLGAGRIGNFINGELWGRPADVPWAMVFPGAGPAPRHPSQLYEFALEGVVLFALVWGFSRRPRPTMAVSGVFALGYGAARFFVEFFREPDAHLGYLAFGWLTMGQLLSLPLVVVGGVLLTWAYRGGVGAAAPGTKGE